MELGAEQTEEDLLLAIACYGEGTSEDDCKLANDAFEELMRKHEQTLNEYVGSSVQKYRTFGFNHEEMYFRLAEKIWRNAGSFSPKSSDPQRVMKSFLKWASTIRENLFNDEVRAIRINFDSSDFDGLIAVLPDDRKQTGRLSPQAAQLAVALETLSARDQDILRSLADNLPLDGRALKSSPEDLRELAARLGVTVPSLTTMRKRAVERLKRAIEQLAPAE